MLYSRRDMYRLQRRAKRAAEMDQFMSRFSPITKTGARVDEVRAITAPSVAPTDVVQTYSEQRDALRDARFEARYRASHPKWAAAHPIVHDEL